MSSKRNSNIEILRIISMILITISHYTVHNSVENFTLPLGINRFILEISTLGNIGTILFVLISGYFMIDSVKTLKLKKIFKLCIQVTFYSAGIYLLLVALNIEKFTLLTFVKFLFPVTFEKYWFITAYVMMCIFVPYINNFLNNIERKDHLNFIIIQIIFFSILHTLTTMPYYGNELFQFMMFYSIGAYLKKYPENLFNKKNYNFKILVLSVIAIIASIIIFDLIGSKFSIFSKNSTYLLNRTSLPAILISVSLLSIFTQKKEFNNKIINNIASCVLGVYLISEHELIRMYIWNDVFHCGNYVSSNFLIIHMFLSVAILFVICIVIEYIRKVTIDKLISKVIESQ